MTKVPSIVWPPHPRHRSRLVQTAHPTVSDHNRIRWLATVVALWRSALLNELEHILTCHMQRACMGAWLRMWAMGTSIGRLRSAGAASARGWKGALPGVPTTPPVTLPNPTCLPVSLLWSANVMKNCDTARECTAHGHGGVGECVWVWVRARAVHVRCGWACVWVDGCSTAAQRAA